MQRKNTESRETPALRGLRLLGPYRAALIAVVGLLFALAAVDLLQPYLLKLLIDDVFIGRLGPEATERIANWNLLWVILPAMALIYVARNALFFVGRTRSLRISEDVCFDLRKRLFEHLQQLSMSFYRSHQPGRVSARLMDDTFKIQTFIQDKFPTFIRYAIEFQVLLVIIYMVNWRLALASTIVLPLHLWTSRHFSASIRQSHSEAQESLAAAHGNIVEKFLGVEVVKSFTGEARESASFRKAIDATRQSTIRSQRFHFAQKVVADLLVGLGTVLLLGFGAWEVKNGRMTGGEFFMFFWYIKMLYPAVLEMISGAGHLSRATGSVDRVFEMLDEPIVDMRSDSEIAVDAGTIVFDDVTFAYDGDGPLVLDAISLTIEPGEHVAITGPSGSGKSTLLSLLPRFNDPTSGEVRINTVPVRSLDVRQLRGLLGIAFQDVFLFNASIYENLRYARPDATIEEVAEACRITGVDTAIERLPHGYDTRIDELAGDLSRGEKQRITLARALLKDPQILLLDEATASIDASSSRKIVKAILERMEGRTVIMVTHDMELMDLVDRVVSIENGCLSTDDRLDDTNSASSSQTGWGGAVGALVLAASLWMTGCGGAEVAVDDDQLRADAMEVAAAYDPTRLGTLGADVESAVSALNVDPRGIRPGAGMTNHGTAGKSADDDSDLPAALLDGVNLPARCIRLIDLPRMSSVEIGELVDRVGLRLNADQSYSLVKESDLALMPQPPAGILPGCALRRTTATGTHVIRFGHRHFVSQPPQLWVSAVFVGADAPMTPSEDLDAVEPLVEEMVASLQEMRGNLAVRDLEKKSIQLSYVDAKTAVTILKAMGMTTISDANTMPAEMAFDSLPCVVLVPDPPKEDHGLVGERSMAQGQFGVSLTPGVAGNLQPSALAAPLTRLLVFYHPAHPDQYSRVRAALDEHIDKPARQIFVEGMVLEIAEEGLKDLGIEWELDSGPVFWRFGSPSADGQIDTVDFQMDDVDLWRVFTRDFLWQWSVKLRTLVRDGKAEVLSRPSVLTLNNRQATIRVGQDIPIATSQEGTSSSSNKIAFNFKYLPTGIMLNIRPRINESGDEVSMLIDTVVSATVPGADLEIRSNDGDLLASAPTVSSRRVQTYARIRNNTPFIVGGLIAKIETTEFDKVPFLGDLPIVGAAFRSERTEKSKREVIIVLTPYVLPEDFVTSGALPKEDDLFDNFGNRLFRDSYRLREQDVFDLRFLFENRRLGTYSEMAQEAIAGNYRLGEQEPFRSFADGFIPGEGVLVTRMIYDLIKRLDIAKPIDIDRVIFFEGQKGVGGYDVRFVEQTMARLAGGLSYQAFFRNLPDKAFALSYGFDRESLDAGRLATEPLPTLTLVDCPDRQTWAEVLWEMNQPDVSGQSRFTILIKDARDLERLRLALALKRVIELNGGYDGLHVRSFNVGRVLLMPEMDPDQVHVIDAEVARLFYYTEHYYAATIQEIERRLIELDRELRRADVRSLLAPE